VVLRSVAYFSKWIYDYKYEEIQYYFLNSLKKHEFLPKLREYVRVGGILIGVSAGSIIMSKTIDIAIFYDENTIGFKDYTARIL